jgi:hypothetical protein
VRYGLATIGLLARSVIDRIGVGRWQLVERPWHADIVSRVREEQLRLGQTTTKASLPGASVPAGLAPAESGQTQPSS